MAKIGLLLPTEKMIQNALHAAEKMELAVAYHKITATADAVNEAREAIDAGAQILISRGYQALLIKKYLNIPMVEMHFTAQEIGLLLKRAKELAGKEHPHIAIVAFQNMLPDLAHMEELFDLKLSIRYIEYPEQTGNILEQMQDDRPDVVIGGHVACDAAQNLGYLTLFYEASEESIREALLIAKNMNEMFAAQRQNEAQFEAVLGISYNGIIRVNQEARVIVINRAIENLLGKSNDEVKGDNIGDLLPQLSVKLVEQILSGEMDQISTSLNIRNEAWMVLIAPIEFDGMITGAIISVRRREDTDGFLQRREQEMAFRGFTSGVTFQDIRTENRLYQEVLEEAKSFALSRLPVLLQIPMGTDVSRLAKAIHNNSDRKTGPFVSFDLEVVEEQEQMQLLFGRGEQGKENAVMSMGAMLKANHGTIFLKNIECLTPIVQRQIVRMLLPWGQISTDAQQMNVLNVRIVASTKCDLKMLAEKGGIEKEFYCLISALKLQIPPLSKRPEDLRALFDERMRTYMKKYNKNYHITDGGYRKLEQFPWDGNEIQVDLYTERLNLSVNKRQIDEVVLENLYDEMYPKLKEVDGEQKYVVYQSEEGERLRELLRKHAGNRQAVAAELGISTTTLWRHMKKYKIESYQ